MSKNDFSGFCALLQSQRKQLLGEIREKIAATDEGPDFPNQLKIGDNDGLPDAAAEMNDAIVVRESQELQEIEAALARIGDGSFGSCSDCGDAIGAARLRAYPAVKRCLHCQEKYERTHGQTHPA